MGRSGNRLPNIRGSCSCAAYAIKEDQEEMAQEEQDVIDRYYFSRYGRNDLNLIRYGERSCFLDPKPRASLGEVPSPKSIVSLYLLSIKFNKKFSKKIIPLFPFFMMRGKNVLTPFDKLKGCVLLCFIMSVVSSSKIRVLLSLNLLVMQISCQ